MIITLFTTAIAAAVGQEAQRHTRTYPADGPLDITSVLSADAQTAASMSLTHFEQLAFRNNPTLAAAAARMNSARGRKLQAGLYPNPVVGYHATEVGNLGTAGQQGAFISQRFITAGKLELDQAIVGAEIAESRFRFHAQEERVLCDVRQRFYDALVAQRRVVLSKQLTRIGDQVVRATETLIDGRQGSENDLLQAELKADESQILLDNAVNEQVEAWRRLAAVVGLPAMQTVQVEGNIDADLPGHDWNACHAAVLQDNPALNAARARMRRAWIVIRRAKKEPVPNIDVSVSMRHHNVTDSEVANVQIGIPIPVFNQNQGNIRSAEAEWVAACNEAKRIELSLQDRLAVTYRRYANARQQAMRYRDRMVPRAGRSLKLVTEGYEKGQVQYLTLLNAQQMFFRVNMSYLEALRELWTASSLIEGQLLTDSLAVRN